MTKIFIGTPCYGGQCTKQYAGSLLNFHSQAHKKGVEMVLDTTENESLITRARNLTVARFMNKDDCSHLLFIDADINFDAQTIFDAIDADEDVVVSPYPKKKINWENGAKAVKEGKTDKLNRLTSELVVNMKSSAMKIHKDKYVDVLDGATGFMLIKKHVFQQMIDKHPELKCKNDHSANAAIKDYYCLFDCLIDPDSKRYLSEDYAFCRRWQMMGGSIKLNIESTLGHVGTVPFTFNLKNRLRTLCTNK